MQYSFPLIISYRFDSVGIIDIRSRGPWIGLDEYIFDT